MKCSQHGTKRERKCRECKELAKRESARLPKSGKGDSKSSWLPDFIAEIDFTPWCD